jgi:hypothetical protein
VRRSNLRQAAVDKQFDAIDEPGIVGGQEHGRLADFVRLAQAAERNAGGKLRLELAPLLVGRG